jgi:hypothetical protein
MVLSVDDLP